MQYLSFFDWLISFSIMSSRFTHAIACVRIFFFFWPHTASHPHLGIKLVPPALEAQSLNHWIIWIISTFWILWTGLQRNECTKLAHFLIWDFYGQEATWTEIRFGRVDLIQGQVSILETKVAPEVQTWKLGWGLGHYSEGQEAGG